MRTAWGVQFLRDSGLPVVAVLHLLLQGKLRRNGTAPGGWQTTMPSSIRISQRTEFFEAKIDSKAMGRPSVGISVQSSAGDVYRVVVTQGRDETRHEVTVTPEDVKRYAPGSTPERLLEVSFEFLLEREPASSILPRFALPVIERYFPEYPRVIGRMA